MTDITRANTGPSAANEDQFIRWAEAHLLRLKTDMAEDLAHEQVARQYQEFIENEGIEFGDPDWIWDENGAQMLVDEILYPAELRRKSEWKHG